MPSYDICLWTSAAFCSDFFLINFSPHVVLPLIITIVLNFFLCPEKDWKINQNSTHPPWVCCLAKWSRRSIERISKVFLSMVWICQFRFLSVPHFPTFPHSVYHISRWVYKCFFKVLPKICQRLSVTCLRMYTFLHAIFLTNTLLPAVSDHAFLYVSLRNITHVLCTLKCNIFLDGELHHNIQRNAKFLGIPVF